MGGFDQRLHDDKDHHRDQFHHNPAQRAA
jgi:hypothetical protein